MKQWIRALALAGTVSGVAGCGVELAVIGAAASAASAGSAVYARGKLQASWLGPFDIVVGAAEEACGDMGLQLMESRGDVTKGVWTIVAMDDHKDKIVVSVHRQTYQLTEFQIDVGLFGKQATAQLYLKRMINAIDGIIDEGDNGAAATILPALPEVEVDPSTVPRVDDESNTDSGEAPAPTPDPEADDIDPMEAS